MSCSRAEQSRKLQWFMAGKLLTHGSHQIRSGSSCGATKLIRGGADTEPRGGFWWGGVVLCLLKWDGRVWGHCRLKFRMSCRQEQLCFSLSSLAEPFPSLGCQKPASPNKWSPFGFPYTGLALLLAGHLGSTGPAPESTREGSRGSAQISTLWLYLQIKVYGKTDKIK